MHPVKTNITSNTTNVSQNHTAAQTTELNIFNSTISNSQTTDENSLDSIFKKLIKTYLVSLDKEYHCCYFLKIKSLCKFIIIDQILKLINLIDSKQKIPTNLFSELYFLMSTSKSADYPAFFEKKVFPIFSIAENIKKEISKNVNLVGRLLKNPNFLEDKAQDFCDCFKMSELNKGIEKICTSQNQIYTYMKPLINKENKNLLTLNLELLNLKKSNKPTDIFDAAIEIEARENLIKDSKGAILSLHALTKTSKHSAMQTLTNLLDPQILCQQSLSLFMKPLQDYTSKTFEEISNLEDYFTKIETAVCFFYKVKQTKNSKDLCREMYHLLWKSIEEYFEEFKLLLTKIYICDPIYFQESKEKIHLYSVVKEVLIHYRDKRKISKEYIKKKFSLSAESPLIGLVSILSQFHESKLPNFALTLSKSQDEVLSRYVHHLYASPDYDEEKNYCNNLLRQIEHLEKCFIRDEKYYGNNPRTPAYILQYFHEFYEDTKKNMLDSIAGDHILKYIEPNTYGISSQKLTHLNKVDGKATLELNKRIMDSIKSIKVHYSMLYIPFLEFLKEIQPLLKCEEIDLGALWIESIEKEEREFKFKSLRPKSPEIINLSRSDKEKIDYSESSSPTEDAEFLPAVTPLLENLTDSLLIGISQLSDISNPNLKINSSKVFSYDLAYHAEIFTNSLEALQIPSLDLDHSLMPLLACGLNSYYYMLEQVITPKFMLEEDSPLTHSISQKFQSIYGLNPMWRDLDKMTIWYRYPNLSLFLSKNYQKNTPIGLQLTLSNDKNKALCDFIDLVKNTLDIFLLEMSNYIPKTQHSLPEFKKQILANLGFLSELESRVSVFQSEKKATNDTLKNDDLSSILPCLNDKFQKLIDSNGGKDSKAGMTFLDLQIHLERLKNCIDLLETTKQQKFLNLHAHTLLMCSQYIVENCYTMLSMANGTELRSHNFKNYINLLNLRKYYSNDTLNFVENYLSLKKGCDYPFMSIYRNKIVAKKGMELLSNSFELAKAGEGFQPGRKNSYSIENYHKEIKLVIKGLISFLKETVIVAEKFNSKIQ